MNGNVENLVCVTRSGELNALAFQGIRAWSCYRQIRDMLQQRFGDALTLLLAIPVENASDGNIDWYSPLRGHAEPIASLPPEKLEGVQEFLRTAASEIEGYARELIDSKDPLKITRGHILKLALRYPDNNYVFVIGEQPVIAAWGFGPGTNGVEPMSLTRVVVRQTPKGQGQNIGETGRLAKNGSWFFWLLPLLALALLFLMLFTSFGPVPALSGRELFHVDGKPLLDDLPVVSDDPEELRGRIQGLHQKLEEHLNQCKPVASQRTSAEEKKPDESRNALAIPQNPENVEFLEGRWMCETGLASTRSGEPVKVVFTFDGSGKGKATILEQNDQCSGDALARLDGKSLQIDMQELVCARQQNSYGKASISCVNSAGNRTRCSGRNYDGSTWDAIFFRLR